MYLEQLSQILGQPFAYGRTAQGAEAMKQHGQQLFNEGMQIQNADNQAIAQNQQAAAQAEAERKAKQQQMLQLGIAIATGGAGAEAGAAEGANAAGAAGAAAGGATANAIQQYLANNYPFMYPNQPRQTFFPMR